MAQQWDVTVNGNALNSNGLTGNNTISAIGTLTYGFLWGCADIWNTDDYPVVTVWGECPSPYDVDPNIEICLE